MVGMRKKVSSGKTEGNIVLRRREGFQATSVRLVHLNGNSDGEYSVDTPPTQHS